MALRDILAAIRHDADVETTEVAADASRRAAELVARAEAEAVEIEEHETHARDSVGRRTAERIVNEAFLEGDRRMREAREALFQQARDRAISQLAAIRSHGEYSKILDRLLAEACDVLPEGRLVHVDPRDAAAIGPVINLRPEDGFQVMLDLDILGGLHLDAGDGRSVVNTFDARLAKADAYLRSLAADILPELRSNPS